MRDSDLQLLFSKCSVLAPANIVVDKSGLEGFLYFDSIFNAMDALVVVNNRSDDNHAKLYTVEISRKTPTGIIRLAFSTDEPEEDFAQKPTPHNLAKNKDWLERLKQNFSSEITDQCSPRTKNAVNGNENIQVSIVKIFCFHTCLILESEGSQRREERAH